MSGHGHTKKYWVVFGSLLVLTTITVAIARVDLAIFAAVAIAMVVAVTKGSLVVAYFMHLIGEQKTVYWILAVTAFCFAILMIVPFLVVMTDYDVSVK